MEARMTVPGAILAALAVACGSGGGEEQARCGNGACEAGETCSECPEDCGLCPDCGDGTCSESESCAACPSDCGACPGCGDGVCDAGESCVSCAADCGECQGCGDGECGPSESCTTCPEDCGTCPMTCTLYVSNLGSDDNPGTISLPFASVDYGLSRVQPGDTLCLREGTYFESPTAEVSGSSSDWITVQSYPGERAVIDSGVPEFRTAGNGDWEVVDASLGEYRSVNEVPSGTIYAYVEGIPGYVNGRVILNPYVDEAAFRASTDEYVDDSTPFYIGPGTYLESDDRVHVRLSKTADLRGAEARYGTVFTSENDDPRNYSILLSTADATLTIAGSYLVVRDITFNAAKDTILFESGSHHVVLDGITAWMGDKTIRADYGDVHDIVVTRSRIYGDRPYWIFWSDMKDPPAPADRLRGTSIDLGAGAYNWEISYNHIRGSGQDLVGVNDDETGVSVHHNRLENCGDDAFELEGTTNVGQISIFENYIGNCLTAVAPGQDTPEFTGPLYVYRNVIVLMQNPPVNRAPGINTWNGGGRFGFEYMFKQRGSSYSTRNTHYYHNTLVMLGTDGVGLSLFPQYPDDIRVANNLLVMVNGVVNRDYPTAPGEVVDGNLYWKVNTVDSEPLLSDYDTVAEFSAATGLEAGGLGSVPRRGTDPLFAGFDPEFVDPGQAFWEPDPASEIFVPSDFMLQAASPAIGAGIAIPPHPLHGSMPDSRSSLDLGAIPYGTPAGEYDVFPFVP